MSRERCVVVKFHDKERYAVAVHCDDKDKCIEFAAYARGLYYDFPYVKFGIYEEGHYEMCKELEEKGEGTLYDLLATTTYYCRETVTITY